MDFLSLDVPAIPARLRSNARLRLSHLGKPRRFLSRRLLGLAGDASPFLYLIEQTHAPHPAMRSAAGSSSVYQHCSPGGFVPVRHLPSSIDIDGPVSVLLARSG
jgi:hypothetical protein